MIYLFPIVFSILPIFMVNWCAKKETEYPNIKIDNNFKKIILYAITLSILEITTSLFVIFKTNYIELIFIWSAVLLLIVISFIDWNTSLIPNRYSYLLVAIGLVSVIYNMITKNTIFIDYSAQLITFFIMSVSFVLIYFISKNGIGMGDVKIIVGCSVFLGIAGTTLMLFFSSVGILVYDIIIKIIFHKKIKELPNNDLPLDSESDTVNGRLMGISKINEHTAIVMGPFLSVAFLLSYFFGNIILKWWFIV